MIYGGLHVSGGIDPTYLALEPQSSTPFVGGSIGLYGIWVDSLNGNALRSDNIYMNVEPNTASIALVPDNNTGQIQLSDGATPEKTNFLTYNSITITDPTNPTQTYNANYNAGGMGTSLVDTGANFSITANVDYNGGLAYEYNDNAGNDTTISIKATNTTGKIRCYNAGISALAPVDFEASVLTLNGNPIGGATPTLSQVLTAGNDATGASITNVNDIQLSSINGSVYPPAVAGFDIVLLNGNNAGASNMDMNTIGLTWGDFTGSNAFTNLPSNAYSVDNGTGLFTDQTANAFRATDTALNGYGELTATGMEIRDLNSSTSTTYNSNNLTIQNGTAYTITQGSGQNINVNCGQFVVNGVPFKVPIYYETHTNSNFGISSGSFQAIGSPITWSGLTPSQSYYASIQFSMSCDNFENSGSIYLDYSNSSGSWTSNTYSGSSYPCPQTGGSNTFSGASGYSCFTIIDSIQFTADSFGQLNIQLNAGHNGGTWNTNYRWTFIGTIIS